jgi:hypothetical protein
MISARRVSEILCCSCRVVCSTSNFFASAYSEPCELKLCGWSYVGESILHAESDAKDVQVCSAAALYVSRACKVVFTYRRRSYSLAKSLASYCQLHAMTRSTRHADSEDIGLSDKRDLYGR